MISQKMFWLKRDLDILSLPFTMLHKWDDNTKFLSSKLNDFSPTNACVNAEGKI
ncbi:MAG: hypothetical protein PWQ22_1026 [Archaeoglobaceae archaeon]|nr:hypothetical protein [Archaeoglobaceae archaeon]MDK2876616.1 hypothetical protein [Archaeoglobaceae archaeon]